MINKVILLGNLGKDPEVKTLENGTKLANFTLATSESYKNKEGQRVNATEWHNVVVWRHLADLAESYLHKGSKIYLEGKITTRSWDDKDGNKRYTTEIVGNNIQFLDPKQEEKPDSSPPETIPDRDKTTYQEKDDLPF